MSKRTADGDITGSSSRRGRKASKPQKKQHVDDVRTLPIDDRAAAFMTLPSAAVLSPDAAAAFKYIEANVYIANGKVHLFDYGLNVEDMTAEADALRLHHSSLVVGKVPGFEMMGAGAGARGVFARVGIFKDTTLMEYTGIVRSAKKEINSSAYKMDLRSARQHTDMALEEKAQIVAGLDELGVDMIDADAFGNISRYVNHSSVPNLRKQTDATLTRVFLVSTRDIKPDEQLSYNYGVHTFGNDMSAVRWPHGALAN